MNGRPEDKQVTEQWERDKARQMNRRLPQVKSIVLATDDAMVVVVDGYGFPRPQVFEAFETAEIINFLGAECRVIDVSHTGNGGWIVQVVALKAEAKPPIAITVEMAPLQAELERLRYQLAEALAVNAALRQIDRKPGEAGA